MSWCKKILTVAPLQLKIKNLFGKIHQLKDNITVILFKVMIKNFLEELEKYGIKLLN